MNANPDVIKLCMEDERLTIDKIVFAFTSPSLTALYSLAFPQGKFLALHMGTTEAESSLAETAEISMPALDWTSIEQFSFCVFFVREMSKDDVIRVLHFVKQLMDDHRLRKLGMILLCPNAYLDDTHDPDFRRQVFELFQCSMLVSIESSAFSGGLKKQSLLQLSGNAYKEEHMVPFYRMTSFESKEKTRWVVQPWHIDVPQAAILNSGRTINQLRSDHQALLFTNKKRESCSCKLSEEITIWYSWLENSGRVRYYYCATPSKIQVRKGRLQRGKRLGDVYQFTLHEKHLIASHIRARVLENNDIKDFENYVLADVDQKPLIECTREDFDEILERLPERKAAEGRKFSEQVERHIRHIMKKVLEVAAQNNVCEDILWGSLYSISESESEETSHMQEFVVLRKSLSIAEELIVAELCLYDAQQDGQAMGLALMFGLGLRNNEACGANFECIRPMQCNQDCFCFWVYQSTDEKGNLRSSGKTLNANRIIPIPTALLTLLRQRRKYITDLVRNGTIVDTVIRGTATEKSDEEIDAFVDSLPIACHGAHFTERCVSRHITMAGATLFKTMAQQMKKEREVERQLAMIDAALHRGVLMDGTKEKDPTAYLLRRNLGTHLYHLGLTEWEIQYIIGHDLEDPNEMRSNFRNEEKLYPIMQKMVHRPILNEMEPEHEIQYSAPVRDFDHHKRRVTVALPNQTGRVKVRIEQREPSDPPKVQVKTAQGMKAEVRCERMCSGNNYDRSMNILETYQRAYQQEISERTKLRARMLEDAPDVDLE